jgi:glycosyltransferase involved in cell wall biosynthesis
MNIPQVKATASHPMPGRPESSGPQRARADVFADVIFVIVQDRGIRGFYGGEKSAVATAAALREVGYRPRFLLTADDDLVSELRSQGLDYDVVPVGNPLAGMRAASWIARVARVRAILRVNAAAFRMARRRKAIVHASGIPAFMCGWLGGRLARAKVIYHVRTASRSQVTRWFETVAVLLADRTITVSESLRRQLLETGAGWARRMAEPRMEAIYNGFDFQEIDRFVSGTSREQARAATGTPPQAVNLLLVGAVFGDKGQLPFIEQALPAVVAAVPDTLVTFVGGSKDDAYLAACRGALSRTGLADRARFTGYLPKDQVFLHYRAADILILASEREGLPRNAIEGHAFGLPLVATAAVGTVEVVRDGTSGYLVDRLRVAGMIQPIVKLAGDASLRERMGRAGAADVRARFNIDQNVREIARVYRELFS